MRIKLMTMFLVIILFLNISNNIIVAQDQSYNVLVLYSQHYSHKWTNELHKGITDALDADNISIFPEYLNEQLLLDEVDYAGICSSLSLKYQSIEFDCIVLVDNYAFNFMEEYYNDFYSPIPLVFVGVNGFSTDMKFTNHMTGIPQNPDLEIFVDLVISLGEKDDELVFMTSTNATSVAERIKIKELMDVKFSEINYRFMISETLEESLETIKDIKSAKLIAIGNIRTEDGNILDPNEMISRVYMNSHLPIYTTNSLHLSEQPNGAVGGYVTDPYEHGFEAGKLAMRVIKGESVESITIAENSPSSYIFNYHMLKQFEIEEDALPEGSKIIGKPDNRIFLKRNVAISGFVVLGVLLVFSILMIFMISIKIKDRNKIIKTRDLLFVNNKHLIAEKNTIIKKEKENLNLLAQLREKQKLASISILASGVAHEINNPINGIMNYGQIILDTNTKDSTIKESAKEIIHESNRIATIVKNLLNFSRQNSDISSKARIEDIVNQTLSLINTIIIKDQINLKVEIDKDLPNVECRSQQIQQVIMNLFTNARDALNERYKDYNDDKKIIVRCNIISKTDKDWVRITVEDHGNGITKSIQDQIFDPFYTTKDRSEGTGLGLSISYGIIEEHGGELTFETEEGKYTRFYIDLPVDKDGELEKFIFKN